MLTKQQEQDIMIKRAKARKKADEIKEKLKDDYYENLLDEINRGLHGSE